MPENFNSLVHVSSLVTKERLDEALTKWFGKDYTFTHWEYAGDFGKGDGTVSDVFRMKLHGVDKNNETNSIKVIIKAVPKNIARTLTCRNRDYFKNEVNFYNNILPVLLAFQSKKKLKNPFDKYAKLVFAYSDGINDVVCLEDAAIDNFGNAVRQEGLNFEHCKLVFEVLAQFHAISFAMKDQEPETFAKLPSFLSEIYYDDHLWGWYSTFWSRISDIAIDAVEKEYPNSIYVEKIKQFAVPERYQNMIDVATKSTENGVICHGDCWMPNFLYKYVDGHAVDVKLIDFQVARYGTPLLDISLMIYTCTTEDLREKHYDELLKIYYDTLSNQLKDLGTDPWNVYSWKQFMEEVKKYSFFGLGYSFESLPFTVLDEDETIDLDIEGDEAVPLEQVYNVGNFKTKEGRLREANNIKHCVDRGYI